MLLQIPLVWGVRSDELQNNLGSNPLLNGLRRVICDLYYRLGSYLTPGTHYLKKSLGDKSGEGANGKCDEEGVN